MPISLRKREPVFYFFSGKGGVGKTSMAAATALFFSKKGKKTLVVSIDPAHSLSDSFETKLGGEVKQVEKNLYAIEIDPEKALGEYKEKFMPKIESSELLSSLGLGDAFDFIGMTPGVDEIAAFDKFLQYMNSNEYDIIIFDTAPTGHALRFLSLPDVLDSWVGKIIKIRMKFSGMIETVKNIFGSKEDKKKSYIEELEKIKERIKKAKIILSDPDKTHFNIVLIPEAMSILESERSLKTINSYGINVGFLVVNQLIPENPRCRFCSRRRDFQQKRLKEIAEKFSGYKIKKVGLFEDEMKGLKMLEMLGKKLY